MDIIVKDGERDFAGAINHAPQQNGSTTGEEELAGGNINATLAQKVEEVGQEGVCHLADQNLDFTRQHGRLILNDLVDIAWLQQSSALGVAFADDRVV